MSTRTGVRRNRNNNYNRNNRTRSRRNATKASMKRNTRRIRNQQANAQFDKYKKENEFLNEFYQSQQSVMQNWELNTIRGGQALSAFRIARQNLRNGNILTASIFFVLATSIAGIYSPRMGTTTGFDGAESSRIPVANMNTLLEYHYGGIIPPEVANDETYINFKKIQQHQQDQEQEQSQRRCPPNLPNCNILGGGQKWKEGDFITNINNPDVDPERVRFYKIIGKWDGADGDFIYRLIRWNGQNETDGPYNVEGVIGDHDTFSITYEGAFDSGYRKVAFSAGGRRRRRRKKKTRKKRGGMDNSEKKTNEITPRNSPSFVPPLQLPPPALQSGLPADVWYYINNHFNHQFKEYLNNLIIRRLNRGHTYQDIDNWLYQVYNSFLQQRQQQQGGMKKSSDNRLRVNWGQNKKQNTPVFNTWKEFLDYLTKNAQAGRDIYILERTLIYYRTDNVQQNESVARTLYKPNTIGLTVKFLTLNTDVNGWIGPVFSVQQVEKIAGYEDNRLELDPNKWENFQINEYGFTDEKLVPHPSQPAPRHKMFSPYKIREQTSNWFIFNQDGDENDDDNITKPGIDTRAYPSNAQNVSLQVSRSDGQDEEVTDNQHDQPPQQQQGGHPGVFTKQADDLRKMSLDRWNRTPISTNEERVREATRRQKKGYAPPPFTSPLERQKSLNIEGDNAFSGGKKSKKVKEMIKIFQQYPDIFPSGYFRFLGGRLENHLKKNTIIFKNGVILTWIKYQKTVKKSEECIYKPGDVKLDQIVNKNPGNGKAKKVMLQFLKKNKNNTVWLEVKKDNKRAIDFYERNGFEEMCSTKFGDIKGIIMKKTP